MRSNTVGIMLSLIVLLPLLTNGQAPSKKYGIKGGLNIAALHSSLDLGTSPRYGYNVGLYHRRGISKKVTFRAEIFYSAEGQNYDSISIGFPITYTGVHSTTTVHKLCTPVLFEVGKKVTLDFGVQIGWLLAANNTMFQPTGSTRRDMKDQLAVADFSLVGGVGFHPARNIEASIRYNHGLSRVFEPFPQHPPEVQFRSRVLQFTVGYTF